MLAMLIALPLGIQLGGGSSDVVQTRTVRETGMTPVWRGGAADPVEQSARPTPPATTKTPSESGESNLPPSAPNSRSRTGAAAPTRDEPGSGDQARPTPTATPTVTATPTATAPGGSDVCATTSLPGPLSGYPNASNTGVPTGMTLRTVSGDFHTSSDGQLISGLNITGRLYIDHDNVKVRCTRGRGMTTTTRLGFQMWSSTLGDPMVCAKARR